ncbi:BMP family ABC transporter substrate-binding protein [Virgibacillus kimchii]
MKSILTIIGVSIFIITMTGCTERQNDIQNVGMLIDSTIEDLPWGEKGYAGLTAIGETYNVNVFYEENVLTKQEIIRAVDEFVYDGVNLIFGHSSIYGRHFAEIAEDYPEVHFVYFNGGYFAENVTSLNFNSHAMGFFAGMTAGEMTSTDQVGIVAAFEWQPEIEGFYEGVIYQNPSAEINMEIINDWNDAQSAVDIYENMKNEQVDVFFPTGDIFSRTIIQQASKDNLYSVGYVEDQSAIGGDKVLTSTIQHVDKLYEITAEEFNNGDLNGTIKTFDFQDDIISMGEFSPNVPGDFQDMMEEAVADYMETGLLPNER